ncbi:MAG: hypothetical protein IPM99_15350 [Rubrivivax sp.]|nr:hypothetical protein [Rubrivivax sp.]
MLLGLLVYGYATGLHSRQDQRAADCGRFIANTQPDHAPRSGASAADRSAVVLMLAREMKCPKLGAIALDGTKIAANASKHSALSEHANRIEAQLREEVQLLLKLAEDSDSRPVGDGLDVPAEIPGASSVWLHWRARTRSDSGLPSAMPWRTRRTRPCAKRQAQREAGKKPRGPEPEPPSSEPRPGDQVNLTDEESASCPLGVAWAELQRAAAVDTARCW